MVLTAQLELCEAVWSLVFLCAGADGEDDGGLVEVFSLLLALFLWTR